MSRVLTILLLLVATTVVPARAQSPDSVPRALVQALLRASMFGLSGAELLVGQVPSAIPAAILPDAKPYGALAQADGIIALFVSPQPKPQADSAWRARLRDAGWMPPPERPQQRRGGFVDASPFDPADPFVGSFCKGGGLLLIGTEPRAGGGSLLTLRLMPSQTGSMCYPQPERSVGTMRMDRDLIALPPLVPPPGAEMVGSGSSGGSSGWQLHTSLRTGMQARDALRHYATQLTAAGWTANPEASVEGASVQTFTKPATASEPARYAVLTMARGMPGQLEATITLPTPR